MCKRDGIVEANRGGSGLGIFSVPLLHSFPPNNLKLSGPVASLCCQCTDFTLKIIGRIFLLEFTENLTEGSQQTLNIFSRARHTVLKQRDIITAET